MSSTNAFLTIEKGIEGNLLGSALTSFGHAGKLLLTMAEEHKGKALLTQSLVLSVQEKLDKWAAAVASVKDALTCPIESVLEAGQQAFAAFAASHEDVVSKALPGYAMDKHDFLCSTHWSLGCPSSQRHGARTWQPCSKKIAT